MISVKTLRTFLATLSSNYRASLTIAQVTEEHVLLTLTIDDKNLKTLEIETKDCLPKRSRWGKECLSISFANAFNTSNICNIISNLSEDDYISFDLSSKTIQGSNFVQEILSINICDYSIIIDTQVIPANSDKRWMVNNKERRK